MKHWLVALAAVLVTVLALATPPDATALRGPRDHQLFASVVQRVSQGEGYYAVMGEELRKGQYPLKPVVTWRTPLHLSTVALLGISQARIALGLLAALTLLVWVTLAWPDPVRMFTAVLLVGAGLMHAITPAGVLMPEVIAGVLIALSLGCYAHRKWLLAALVGALAMFVRELALPYVLICAALAYQAKRRQETAVWIAGVTLFWFYYATHAWLASRATMPTDVASSATAWVQWQGLPFLLETIRFYPIVLLTSPIVGAIVLGLGTLTLGVSNAPIQVRAAWLAYAGLYLVFGQPFNGYWGLLTCPLWGVTLTYLPEAISQTERALRFRLSVFQGQPRHHRPIPHAAPARDPSSYSATTSN